MMTKRFISTLLSSLLVCTSLWASNDTIVSVSPYSPSLRTFSQVYSNATAHSAGLVDYSWGDVGAKYNYQDLGDIHLLQDGDRVNQYGLYAKGNKVMGNKLFWGEAGYRNVKNKNRQWNDVYNHRRVGPYLVADELGGDAQGEEYNVSGGLSLIYGKWLIGGQASYVAGQSYRKVDPRPKVTATDLLVQLSLGYIVSPSYQVGVSGDIGKYQEDVSIKVFRESTNYKFYALRGFGQQWLKGFDESSSYDWNYEATNYKVSAYFMPRSKTGFLGNLSFRYESMDAIVGSKTATRTPSTLNTSDIDATLGWQKISDNSRTQIAVDYNRMLSKGIERAYYKEKVNDVFDQYFELSAMKLYTQKQSLIGVTALHEVLDVKGKPWAKGVVNYMTSEERYAYPQYKMDFKYLLASVELGAEFEKKKSTFVPKLGISYRPTLSTDKVLPENNELFEKTTRSNIAFYEADIWSGNIGLTYEYNIRNKMKIYGSGEGIYNRIDGKKQVFFTFAVGIRY